jgi:adenylate kinase family enzyme
LLVFRRDSPRNAVAADLPGGVRASRSDLALPSQAADEHSLSELMHRSDGAGTPPDKQLPGGPSKRDCYASCSHGAMQRVVVLGSVGAGKTTLATTISRRTGLPLVHLDRLFWRSGWTPAPREEALRDLADAIQRDRWILDGNFLADRDGGWDARFDRADTVIFLDVPRRASVFRVLKRRLREPKRSRPDLPEACSEGLALSVFRWIWAYPTADRPCVLGILERLGEDVDVHHLRSRSDVQRFVAALSA